MVKAIFFDIDGTLLSYSFHRVLPGTEEALQTLRRRGVRLFISSGRPRVLIPELPLPFDGYITVNGGYCFSGDTVLMRHPIDPEDCRSWLDIVENEGMTTMAFGEHDMFINRIAPEAVRLHDQLGFKMPPLQPLELMRGSEVFQFIALQPADRDAAVLARLPHCRMPRWHQDFSDIVPEGISKAVGIERMLQHFGIHRSEAMAFGDGTNDIEMLEYVGCGVAMGNANDQVKAHARFVTDDSDHEGILHALSKLKIL